MRALRIHGRIHKETGHECVNSTDWALDKTQWCTLVNMVMNIQVL